MARVKKTTKTDEVKETKVVEELVPSVEEIDKTKIEETITEDTKEETAETIQEETAETVQEEPKEEETNEVQEEPKEEKVNTTIPKKEKVVKKEKNKYIFGYTWNGVTFD